MTIRITAKAAYEALAAVVAAKKNGDKFIYRPPKGELSCVYIDKNKPSCLVGQALDRLGIDRDRMANWDEGTDSDANLTIATVAALGFLPEASQAAIEVLDRAQRQQDHLGTWGEALAAAKRRLKGYSG